MPETKQISATIDTDTVEAIQGFASVDKRSFSEMVAILLDEAVRARNLIHEQ